MRAASTQSTSCCTDSGTSGPPPAAPMASLDSATAAAANAQSAAHCRARGAGGRTRAVCGSVGGFSSGCVSYLTHEWVQREWGSRRKKFSRFHTHPIPCCRWALRRALCCTALPARPPTDSWSLTPDTLPEACQSTNEEVAMVPAGSTAGGGGPAHAQRRGKAHPRWPLLFRTEGSGLSSLQAGIRSAGGGCIWCSPAEHCWPRHGLTILLPCDFGWAELGFHSLGGGADGKPPLSKASCLPAATGERAGLAGTSAGESGGGGGGGAGSGGAVGLAGTSAGEGGGAGGRGVGLADS